MSQVPPDSSPTPDYKSSLYPTKGAPPGLTPEQLMEIERAKVRGKKIRRAVSIAYTDAWISAVFAGGGILLTCGGIENLVMGLLLGVVAFNSFRGAAALRRFDLEAPGKLAMNQLLLASFIIAYAAYQIWSIRTGRSSLAAMLGGGSDYKDLGSAGVSMQQIQGIVIEACYAVYVTLIVGTIVAQGLTAWYYKSRKKLLVDYCAQTPAWVMELMAAKS